MGALAVGELLLPVPAPFPATLSVARTISAQALVSFRGNQYPVPPELTAARVVVTGRLGGSTLDRLTSMSITWNSSGTNHDVSERSHCRTRHSVNTGDAKAIQRLYV